MTEDPECANCGHPESAHVSASPATDGPYRCWCGCEHHGGLMIELEPKQQSDGDAEAPTDAGASHPPTEADGGTNTPYDRAGGGDG